MDYTVKKKITHYILNILTFIVVFLNLFPILWMVYSSLMNNNDIVSGKLTMSRRENHVIAIFKGDNEGNLIFGTKDGSINKYKVDENNKASLLLRKNFNAFGVSYVKDGDYIWIFSADKGLIKVNIKNFKVEKRVKIKEFAKKYQQKYSKEMPKIYITDVVNSSLVKYKDNLYIGLWYPKAIGVMVYNTKNGNIDFITRKEGLKSGVVKYISLYNDKLYLVGEKKIHIYNPSVNRVEGYIQPYKRELIKEILPLEKGYFLVVRETATDVWLYKVEGRYFKALYKINDSLNLKITRVASIQRSNIDKSLIFIGNYTDGALYELSYKIVEKNIVLDSSNIEAPALERPIENVRKEIYPEFKLVKTYSIILKDAKTNNEITGDVNTVIYEGKDKIVVGSDWGKVSIIDKETGKVLSLFRLPKGKIYIHWYNYVDLWRNIDFGLYLKNSLIICFTVMIIAMFLASLAGYALARYEFPGKELFGYTVLATQMIPGIMFLIPIYLMFVKFNELTGIPVKGTYWGLIFTYSAFFVPFSIWILRGFFASIPKELEEAALIDGCTPFEAFIKVIIPSAMPGIVATGIYVFLTAWDELMFAWILTNESTYTIPVGIRNYVGNYQNRYDLMMAAATVATLPVMALFFMMQKQIVSGLTAGAVKE